MQSWVAGVMRLAIQLAISCPARQGRRLTTANSPAMKAARQALRWTLPLVVFRMTLASATTTAWQPTPWCAITCTQAAASARIEAPENHVASRRQRHSEADRKPSNCQLPQQSPGVHNLLAADSSDNCKGTGDRSSDPQAEQRTVLLTRAISSSTSSGAGFRPRCSSTITTNPSSSAWSLDARTSTAKAARPPGLTYANSGAW